MFNHLFSYMSKIHLSSRSGLIFSILIPFCMSLIFLFAFEGLVDEESFPPVPVAISYQHASADQIQIDQVEVFLDQVGEEGQVVGSEVVPVDPKILLMP